ncbi:hypothetical protein [Halobellus sp. GM3]|uniref:hypothetical protein n=1 Tax=Halobellus sp. GM3 TaxID=3458410 RepID=UPI00403DFAD7
MSEDPRLTGEFVRRLPATSDGGPVTLVGVVHDHPASTYRTRRIVSEAAPDVLALELPSLAVPLFVEYARDGDSPPSFGGEMSTAIRAAETERVVGIDGPSVGFARRLLARVATERPPADVVRSVLSGLWSATAHAAVCRAAAVCSRSAGFRVEVDRPIAHESTIADDPSVQAADERAQVRQSKTILNAFQTSGASAVRRSAREAHMADRIHRLRGEGAVTAVVGIGHLDPLAEALGGE